MTKASHGGKRRGSGRPRKPDGQARTALLRVSPVDLERWRERAAELGYADVYDMITCALEQLDPHDVDGQLADFGREVLALARTIPAPDVEV